jgi:choline dehydrogenase-like flavoprotein
MMQKGWPGVSDPFSPNTPAVITEPGEQIECDIAIVGSGMGGATAAWALRESGARVLVLERGDFLPRERENWSARDVLQLGRYKNSDPWIDQTGRSFVPGNYHYVGGSTKFYGATLPRMREHDFTAFPTEDGTSPAWPISYAELEPFYGQAEALYWVHGAEGDPTEPWRSTAFPFPAVPHEPAIARVAERMARQGLHPFSLPQAVDSRAGGQCVLCRTCDAYPCMVDAKGEADVSAMRPALQSPTVRLLTHADVRAVATTEDGATVTHLDVRHHGRPVRVHASRYVMAAGAVQTAALLLRSREHNPAGVANSSDLVGRNYMAHISSFVVGVRPGPEHHTVFQKTLGMNDYYRPGPDNEFPLGNVQGLGKLQGPSIKAARRWVPTDILEWMTRRSVDFFVETEDLPRPENRVWIDDRARIHLEWAPTNVASHHQLVDRMRTILRKAGYPLVFVQELGVEATSHQCGTARMGDDPATSVVDRDCRAHDVGNLWILDTSVFCSSAAVNPALTAAANVMRVIAGGGLTA